MKKLYTFCLLATISYSAYSQVIEWENTIGGNQWDVPFCIKPTSDGGYILGGYSWSDISGDKNEDAIHMCDYWVVKTDRKGNILWQRTIGGTDIDELFWIEQTNDGGYILGGDSYSNISGHKSENSLGDRDYWIVKLDAVGNIEWDNTIGGNAIDRLSSVIQTSDDGYLISGYSTSGISGDKSEPLIGIGGEDWWVIKTDQMGVVQWDNTIGGTASDRLTSVIQVSDGGYVLGGSSGSGISSDKSENSNGGDDYWLVKIDSIGNIQWQNTIGGSLYDQLQSIRQTGDGGYILGGYSQSNISGDKTKNSKGGYDYWIIKTDSVGNIEWQNTIGGNSMEQLHVIRQTFDGGFVLGGYSQSDISGDKNENSNGLFDFWVVKVNSTGIIEWQNSIGGADDDRLYSLEQAGDGGIITAGWSKSNISGDKNENCIGNWDYWIVKLTSNFNLLTGECFLDLNSNSLPEIGEPKLKNHTVYDSNSSRFVTTNQNGGYELTFIDTGSFNINPIQIPNYTLIPGNYSGFFNSLNQLDSLKNFAFQPQGAVEDLYISLSPIGAFRPGFDAHYNIHYKNIGTVPTSGTVIFIPDTSITFVSSLLTPSFISTDSVKWMIPVLDPYESANITVTVNVNLSNSIGSWINSIAKIEPLTNDPTPYNNTGLWRIEVTGSYDPNDILVSREVVYKSELSSPPYLDYLIRFQNTGTDTAFTVNIKNPLPFHTEFLSFELLESSHPVELNFNDFANEMWFEFTNILLPDSNTNELLSHGFVRYRIKPKSSLVVGDLIENSASIFFDFNAPVITNTAFTEIVQLFTPTITPSNLILCPNESDTLWTQVYDSYQWYKDGNIIPGATQQFLVVDYFNDAGYYFKVEVDSSGFFETSDSVLVDGWAFLPPFVIQSGDFTIGSTGEMIICPGDTAYLILGNPYNTNIQWTDNGVAISGATDDTLIVTQAGLFHVTGSPSQCPNYVQGLFDNIQVVMANPPAPTVAPNNLILCPNETDTLWTQVFGSYQWYKDGILIPGATQQFLVVDQFNDAGSMFSVEVTQNSCAGVSQSVLVDGWAFLPPFVMQEGTFTIGSMGELLMCPGDTAYLILGQPYDTNIQWTDNSVAIPGANNDTLIVTTSGLYNVSGSPAVCPNFVQGLFDDITVIVQGPPMPVISLSGNNLTTQSGFTYQWYLNGNPIAGNNNTIPIWGAGSYTVLITDANGCTATSSPFVVTSVIENPLSGTVSVNYNSSTQMLNINRTDATGETEFFVLDVIGRVIAKEKIAKGISQIDIKLNNINSGIYFVKSSGGNTVKFFVE